jgi:hypothetical protein
MEDGHCPDLIAEAKNIQTIDSLSWSAEVSSSSIGVWHMVTLSQPCQVHASLKCAALSEVWPQILNRFPTACVSVAQSLPISSDSKWLASEAKDAGFMARGSFASDHDTLNCCFSKYDSYKHEVLTDCSELLKDISDAFGGPPIPQGRNASLFSSAFENSR